MSIWLILGLLLGANVVGSGTAYIVSADRECRNLKGRTVIRDMTIYCVDIPEDVQAELKRKEKEFIDSIWMGTPRGTRSKE